MLPVRFLPRCRTARKLAAVASLRLQFTCDLHSPEVYSKRLSALSELQHLQPLAESNCSRNAVLQGFLNFLQVWHGDCILLCQRDETLTQSPRTPH